MHDSKKLLEDDSKKKNDEQVDHTLIDIKRTETDDDINSDSYTYNDNNSSNCNLGRKGWAGIITSIAGITAFLATVRKSEQPAYGDDTGIENDMPSIRMENQKTLLGLNIHDLKNSSREAEEIYTTPPPKATLIKLLVNLTSNATTAFKLYNELPQNNSIHSSMASTPANIGPTASQALGNHWTSENKKELQSKININKSEENKKVDKAEQPSSASNYHETPLDDTDINEFKVWMLRLGLTVSVLKGLD
ncbi:hypothetical protein [Chromobacterium haemolyticum]|uniref:hypothetical protein n=1 Tax=Chromobacterium haemolyticum TaxID=394935 RepID=UPI00113266D2|nr:hypothetical protein [Chromobacterium haemolyticum]